MPSSSRKKEHFKRAVIDALAKRASQRCSFCGLATSGPHDDSSKWINVGEAAHIKAEAPGGPRYDLAQTLEERKGITNGIWLCNKHHKLIDSDVDRFSVATLLQMKEAHEARILREIEGGGSAPGLTKIFSVPFRRNPYFTGREDVLENLAAQLKTGGKAAPGQVAAISGLGGIGKTQTAVEFAYRHREEYRAVFFVRAETEVDLLSGFAAISALLRLPEAGEQNQRLAAQAARRWLETHDGWLLILDNADTPSLLDPFLPVDSEGHVLVTSRAQNFATLHVVPQRLAPPPSEEAVAFLLHRTARKETSEMERRAAADLAVELGNLPLALEQAAAYLAERQASFVDYLASYLHRGLELLAKANPEAGTGHDPVAVTWSLNFREVESISPASADLLRASAFLAPDAIPDEFFLEGGAEISDALGAAVAERDSLAVTDVAAPLLRYSLVDRNPENRTLSVHRLVQAIVKENLGEYQKAMQRQVVRALKNSYPSPEFRAWPLTERFLPHLLSNANESSNSEDLDWLLEAAAFGLSMRFRLAEAAPLFSRLIRLREKELGESHPRVAKAPSSLAFTYRNLERLVEAESLYLRAFAICGFVPEKVESAFVARMHSELATLYAVQGKLGEAEAHYLRALDSLDEESGHDALHAADSLRHLANFYRQHGRLDEAERLLLRSLGIIEVSVYRALLSLRSTADLEMVSAP